MTKGPMTKAEAERSGSAATHDDSSLGIGHSSLIRHSGFDIRHSTDARVVLASVLLFSAISLALNVTSSGFLEADGITHYLYARWAIAEPHLLTNVWGRPFVTAIHALPAQLPGTFLGQPWGLIGVRAASMLLAVGSALLAWRVAVGQGPAYGHDRPGLAALFLLCMPLVILHSISELTELPFAFLAILALWAYQKRAWWLLALAAGLLPAARPEGFGFALLAVGGLVLHRRWEVLILPLPVIAWDRLGWWQYGHEAPGAWWHLFRWLAANWPYSGESAYKPGPLLKFVGMLPAVVGPLIMPMLIVGIVAAFRTRGPRAGDSAGTQIEPAGGQDAAVEIPYATPATPSARQRFSWRDHHVRVAWLIAFVPLLVLVVHSLLHWRGKMASSGEIRYLACVAPFWALLAARGWDELSRRLRWRWDYLLAAVAAVGPVLAMQLYYPIVPLEADVPGREAVEVARWYEQSELSRTHPRLMSDHPIIWYTLDLNPQKKGAGKDRIREPEPGSTFLWHDIYSTHNADDRYIVPADLPPQHGWREVTPQEFRDGWRVFVFDGPSREEVALARIGMLMTQAADSENPAGVQQLEELFRLVKASGLDVLEDRIHPVSAFLGVNRTNGPQERLVFTYLTLGEVTPDRLLIERSDGAIMWHMASEGVHEVEREGVLRLGIVYFTMQNLALNVRDEDPMSVTPFAGTAALSDKVRIDLSYK